MKPQLVFPLAALLVLLGHVSPGFAQTTAFTYQGRLTENGVPANGSNDFTFTLYDAASDGATVGTSNVVSDLAVTNGLFTATLNFINFAAVPFDGNDRWLQIAVRPGASTGAYMNLLPRQLITSAPYAIRALNAGSAVIASSVAAGAVTSSGLAAGAVGSNQLAAGAVTTAALANGAVTAPKMATVSNWFAVTFANPTPVTDDFFGFSVAAVGSDRVLIGAPQDDTGAGNAGAAYLFSANGALLTTFTNPFPAAFDFLGYSVAALGTDRVLIGAYQDDWGASDAGAAYLFSTNGTLLTTFTNPTPAANDYFGWSVAAVGSGRVLIGAYNDNAGGVSGGAAYLFNTNGTLLTTLTNPTPAGGDQFGISVAALGSDRLLIGARLDDTGAADSGAAYLFSPNGTLLATFANPTPADSDLFGHSVAALGNDRVLIGAHQDDTGAPSARAAYLFSAQSFTPGLVADGVRAGSVTTSSLADGAVIAAKIGGVLLPGQIPDLDASKISGGTLTDARLSTNVALRAGGNAFTGNQTIAGSAGIGTVNPRAKLKAAGPSGTSVRVTGPGSVGTTVALDLATYDPGAGNAPSARIQAKDNNFSGSLDFLTKQPGAVNNPMSLRLQLNLHGHLNIDPASAIGGAIVGQPALVFGDGTSGEGIASKRTGGGNQFGLDFYTSYQNRMTILNNGNVGIGTTAPATVLQVNGTVTAIAFNPSSNRHLKENFTEVSPRETLDKVATLTISRWNFKGDATTPHVGPMAQDFHAAFGLGTDDKHIATVDADGVALVAIQGLNQKLEAEVKSKDTRIAELERRLSVLETLLQK